MAKDSLGYPWWQPEWSHLKDGDMHAMATWRIDYPSSPEDVFQRKELLNRVFMELGRLAENLNACDGKYS